MGTVCCLFCDDPWINFALHLHRRRALSASPRSLAGLLCLLVASYCIVCNMDPLKEQQKQQQQQPIETPPTSGNIAINTNALFSTPNREAAVTVNVDGADDLDILQQSYSDDIVLPSPVSDYVMSDEELDMAAIYGDEEDEEKKRRSSLNRI